MNPVDGLAALRALIHGATAALPRFEAEVKDLRSITRAKGFESDWGSVSFRKNPAKIRYNQSKLLAWAQVNMPHQVVPEHTEIIPAAVHPTMEKSLDGRLKIDGDSVIDTKTGEVVDFAYVDPGRDDTLVFSMPQERKDAAAEMVAERVEALTAAVSTELAA